MENIQKLHLEYFSAERCGRLLIGSAWITGWVCTFLWLGLRKG